MKYPITDCKINDAVYIGSKKISTYNEWKIDAFKEYFVNKDLEKL